MRRTLEQLHVMNRKPVMLIFTLEQAYDDRETLAVIGRSQVELRTCSCPKRDKKQDEVKIAKVREIREVAGELARSNSCFTKPTAKKRKANEFGEVFVMVPVRKRPLIEIHINFILIFGPQEDISRKIVHPKAKYNL